MDTHTLAVTKMRLLADEAGIAVWAYYLAPNFFLFLPHDEYGTPSFDKAMADAAKKGASLLGMLALLDRTVNGQVLIEYELAPGGSEEAMERAKLRFRDTLIEAGVLTLDTSGAAPS